ncbi:MAG: DUF2254 domain-containing protein [Planctomycetaceae bacterium]|nr:DUF2254 domain-containing protein [Planctomycetaceae bacterium]
MAKVWESLRRFFSRDSRGNGGVSGAWVIAVWDSWRTSFWFIPSIATAFAVLAGILLPVVDEKFGDPILEAFPFIETTSSASRTTIAAMAGALFTVTGVIFSVTMVTLSLTTSQFGPRLLRTFMDNSVSQITLGVFLATSVYCLLVLRAVRTVEGEVFVPNVSTAIGVLASVSSLVLLIVFVQFVANSIQAENVIRAVADDLRYAINTLYPEPIGEGEEVDRPSANSDPGEVFSPQSATTLYSDYEGYVQGIDIPSAMESARSVDGTLKLLRRPGDYVAIGIPVLAIESQEEISEHKRAELLGALIVGRRRTPRQDLLCAVDELVEVAVRALSPGINDPFTAMTCVDALSGCLHLMAGRKIPSPYCYDDDGTIRALVERVTFDEAMSHAFDLIRHDSRDSPVVLRRLLEAYARILKGTKRRTDQICVRMHAKLVVETAEQFCQERYEVDRVREAYALAFPGLAASP